MGRHQLLAADWADEQRIGADTTGEFLSLVVTLIRAYPFLISEIRGKKSLILGAG